MDNICYTIQYMTLEDSRTHLVEGVSISTLIELNKNEDVDVLSYVPYYVN